MRPPGDRWRVKMIQYRRGRGNLFHTPYQRLEVLYWFQEWMCPNYRPHPLVDLRIDGTMSVSLMDGAFQVEGLIDPCELVVWDSGVLYRQQIPPCASREYLVREVFEPFDKWVRSQSFDIPEPSVPSDPVIVEVDGEEITLDAWMERLTDQVVNHQ